MWEWIEWMATLLQSQERLIRIPRAAFMKPLSVHFLWHCLSLYAHIRLFSHGTSALCASDEQWSLAEELLHAFCIAQHAQHIYCITPRQKASLHCLFPSILLCIRFLTSSIPGPTFSLPILVSVFSVRLSLIWSPTPVYPFQVDWHYSCSKQMEPLLR